MDFLRCGGHARHAAGIYLIGRSKVGAEKRAGGKIYIYSKGGSPRTSSHACMKHARTLRCECAKQDGGDGAEDAMMAKLRETSHSSSKLAVRHTQVTKCSLLEVY